MSTLSRIAVVARRLGRLLPPRRAWWLGGLAGFAYAHIPGRDTRRAREHLGRAFPDLDTDAITRLVRRCFRHFGRMVLWNLAILHLPPQRLRRIVVVTGHDSIRAARRAAGRGEGTLAVSGHLGNWELLALVAGTFLPVTVVGRHLHDPDLDCLLVEMRTAWGNRQIHQNQGLNPCVRELRSGRLVCTLTDQDVPRLAGGFVPWFGVPAWTPIGPAAMALMARAPVMPVFCYHHGGRWVLRFGERRVFHGSGDRDQALLAITAWTQSSLEALVRRHPEQWPWWHKRWRTRPEDRPQAPGAVGADTKRMQSG